MRILNLSFNQDISFLTCSTNEGYIIYELKPKTTVKRQRRTAGGIGMYKMIYDSSVGVITGGGDAPYYDKKKVIIYDEVDKAVKMEITMSTEVKNVAISRRLIVVCLETTVFAYNFQGKLVAQITTINNPKGICSLSRIDDTPILATLGATPGELFILDIKNRQSTKIEKAHVTGISALAINPEGTLVATASECGTLIRVFDVRSTKMMYEFRRGSSTSKIYDITFNKDSDLIACSSSNGTVHIFQLTNDLDNTKNTLSYFNSARNFLPSFFSSQWSFKQIRVETESKIICAFDDNDVLHIATYDGKYWKAHSRNNDYKMLAKGEIKFDFSDKIKVEL